MYPLTAYDSAGQNPIPVSSILNQDLRAQSPENKDGAHTDTTTLSTSQTIDRETRRVINMMCNIKPRENNGETELTVRIMQIIHIYAPFQYDSFHLRMFADNYFTSHGR